MLVTFKKFSMLIITIKQGKEKSLLAHQPWVYASAVERVDGRAQEKMTPGVTALVHSSAGHFLARAAYNSRSQIRARVWSFDLNEAVDHAMIKRRVKAAVAKRGGKPAASIALVIGDEDGLSGLLVQWYGGIGGFLVCEFQAAGVEAWKVAIVQALMAETGCRNVYEQCSPLLRKGEGLPMLSGVLAGEAPPESLKLSQGGATLSLDIKRSKKPRA